MKRKTCGRCGRDGTWTWTTRGGKNVLVDALLDGDGNAVFNDRGTPAIDPKGTVHGCYAEDAEDARSEAKITEATFRVVDSPTDAPTRHPETRVIEASATPAPKPPQTTSKRPSAPLPTDVLGQTLWTILEPYVTSSVDRETVEGMIAEGVAKAMAERGQPKQIIVGDMPPVTVSPDDHHSMAELVALIGLSLDTLLWPYIWGPSGTGKTYAATKIGEKLGMAKDRIVIMPLGPRTMPETLFGFPTATGATFHTLIRKVWEHGGMIVFDEFDMADGEVSTLLNGAISSDVMTFPDACVQRHRECYLIATGNTPMRGATAAHGSRRKQEASTQDRFVYLHWTRDTRQETARIRPILGERTEVFVAWLAQVREHLDTHRADLVSSQRSAVAMAAAFANARGVLSRDTILDGYLFRGIGADVKRAILQAAPLPRFMAEGR